MFRGLGGATPGARDRGLPLGFFLPSSGGIAPRPRPTQSTTEVTWRGSRMPPRLRRELWRSQARCGKPAGSPAARDDGGGRGPGRGRWQQRRRRLRLRLQRLAGLLFQHGPVIGPLPGRAETGIFGEGSLGRSGRGLTGGGVWGGEAGRRGEGLWEAERGSGAACDRRGYLSGGSRWGEEARGRRALVRGGQWGWFGQGVDRAGGDFAGGWRGRDVSYRPGFEPRGTL